MPRPLLDSTSRSALRDAAGQFHVLIDDPLPHEPGRLRFPRDIPLLEVIAVTQPLPASTTNQLQVAVAQVQDLRRAWPERAAALDDRVLRPLRSRRGAEAAPADDGSRATGATDDPPAPRTVEGTADSADGWHDSLSAVTDAVGA